MYYSRACELAGPYLLLVLEKAEGVAAYCMAALESAAQYIPLMKEKVFYVYTVIVIVVGKTSVRNELNFYIAPTLNFISHVLHKEHIVLQNEYIFYIQTYS